MSISGRRPSSIPPLDIVIREAKNEDDVDEQLALEFQNTINLLRAERNDEVNEEENEGDEYEPSIAIPNTRRKSSLLVAPDGEILKKLSAPSSLGTVGTMSSRFEVTNNVKLLSPERKRDLIQIFNLFDTDGSGTMEMGELKVVLWGLGFQPEPGIDQPDLKYSN